MFALVFTQFRGGLSLILHSFLTLFRSGSDTGGDIYGATPLKEAANYNKIECVEILIAAGADVNQGDRGTYFTNNSDDRF